MPAGYFDQIKQNRKNGILILYPFSTKYKADEGFDKNNSINASWELIIPKTATGEENTESRLNVAYNQVKRDFLAANTDEINF